MVWSHIRFSVFFVAEPAIKWREGDVAASILDLDEGTVSFYRNGALIGGGPAFEGLVAEKPMYPTASLSSFQRLSFNFGQMPFKVLILIPFYHFFL